MHTRTGRLVHHDPRSRSFETVRRTVVPKSVLHHINAPALDQGNLNGCTGFAAAQWLNTVYARAARQRFNVEAMRRRDLCTRNEHGVALYSKATRLDDFPWTYEPDDKGSSGLGVAKALQAFGAIDRYEWTFSFAQFLAALQVQPLIVGTAWTDSMFDPDSKGVIRVTTDPANAEAGHEYLIHGVNWPRKMIRMRNNWTPQWGLDGDAFIPFEDMEKLLDAQGDCLVPVVTP